MTHDNEDALHAKIREHADVIRYLGQNVRCHPDDAWSKRQVIAMLDEISDHADAILKLTGVPSLERHFNDVWPDLGESRSPVTGNGLDKPFQAYADDGEAA